MKIKVFLIICLLLIGKVSSAESTDVLHSERVGQALADSLNDNGRWIKQHYTEGAAQSTPPSGTAVTYVKTDGKLYLKDDAGTESDLTGTIDGTGTANQITYWVDSDTIGALAVATYPSLAELAYGKGVTSAIQTQFGLKAPLASPTFTTQISTPLITTASGALGITPAAGSNLNVTLSTTGDFAVNTNQLYVDTSTGYVGIGTVSPDSKLVAEDTVSATDNVATVFEVNRMTTGTAAAGFGPRMAFKAEDAGGYKEAQGYIHTYWLDPATGVRSAKMGFDIRNGSAFPNIMTLTNGGNVGIGTTSFGTNATKVVALGNGTAPSTSIVDGIQFWAEDVAASSELRVRDEAGNVTTLSPHPTDMMNRLPVDADHAIPWAYSSTNEYLGKRIDVDMALLVAEAERRWGVSLKTVTDIAKRSMSNDRIIHATQINSKKKETWKKENGVVVGITEAIETIGMEVDDIDNIVSKDITYELDANMEKVKKERSVYGKKIVQKKKLKDGYSFDNKTGEFKRDATDAEIAAAVAVGRLKLDKVKPIPKYLLDRGAN